MIRYILLCITMVLAVPAAAQTQVPASQGQIALSFAPVVKRAAPAVVNIYAKRMTEARPSPFAGDPFFEDFFRGFGRPQPRVQNSLGSGVILDESGIVMSNYHVVGGATDIRVVLADRREFQAHVLLADEMADLAVLQIDDAEDLPALSLRDSDAVEVGELVLAIGNPFGVGQTVTSGIISGLARAGVIRGNARSYFLQTDAPINPGNSGGALVDVNGDLIGINTAILSRSGGSNGIGFAIPANLVRAFLEQAKDGHDQFQRPWAGMSGQEVDGDLADSLGLGVPGGILIAEMHRASPFRAAGFEVGDLITHVGGLDVNSPAEMVFRMTIAGLGGTATVTRVRGGVAEDIEVAMIDPPDDPPAEETVLDENSALPGLTVARINPAVILRHQLGLRDDGVAVLEPGRVGAWAGLQRGDILLEVNGRAIERSGDVVDALSRQRGRVEIEIEIERGGRRYSLAFRT
ncbi:trypsin-like peptidase domain-containing protein [Chachezhania antarctica]|uniref:trypsin-like peptidase domain-containing protein n=1 Tax=Chachezhania antarctica TaxID=2340860 RepID=UPI000EACF6DC|nr:trypsin-like peptidase domain-containing protein [Chachezhania antarctica]